MKIILECIAGTILTIALLPFINLLIIISTPILRYNGERFIITTEKVDEL